jgi:hypothetical protein
MHEEALALVGLLLAGKNGTQSVYIFFSFPVALGPVFGMASPFEASRSHSQTPHSVGLLWTSDQPDTQL